MSPKSHNLKLAQYLIPGTDEAYYIPEFITPDEEQFLLRKACLAASSHASLVERQRFFVDPRIACAEVETTS